MQVNRGEDVVSVEAQRAKAQPSQDEDQGRKGKKGADDAAHDQGRVRFTLPRGKPGDQEKVRRRAGEGT